VSNTEQIIQADLTWTGEQFESDIQITVDADGLIRSVAKSSHTPTLRLTERAILPGFVNAHSHAFQRSLRGSGESFPKGAGSFWSWREAMYELVQKLNADKFYTITRDAFAEMRRAGITTVGEFHYLHHSGNELDYEFDALTLKAATETGIRIVLLNAFYKTGGINQPLNSTQQRFRSEDATNFLDHLDGLMEVSGEATHTFGVVAHSVRAASPQDLGVLHEGAVKRGLPFHIHMEEQLKEIEDVVAAYGKTPLAVLNDAVSDASNVTAVHCTHSSEEDLSIFFEKGGTVAVCPLTEANLGDGIPRFSDFGAAAKRISLGTDSNLRIAMTEEMRWLEYAQRLDTQSRGVYRNEDGNVASALLDCATKNGAAALGIDAGQITPGYWADFASIDLTHPSLNGEMGHGLLDAYVFGTGDGVVTATCVAGQWQDHR